MVLSGIEVGILEGVGNVSVGFISFDFMGFVVVLFLVFFWVCEGLYILFDFGIKWIWRIF